MKVLAFTRADERRAQNLDETSALVLLAIARILAQPERLTPDLLATLAFNADEALAAIDERRA